MSDITETRREGANPPPSLWLRLGWFVGLWAAGVVAVGIVAYGLRLAIR